MNSTLAWKPFSAFELVAGSAALALVASIAFVGLRVAQPQTPSLAVPLNSSSTAIPSSWAVTGSLREQLSERSEKVDAARTPQPVNHSSADDKLILQEPGGAKARGSPALDGTWRFDETAGVEQRLIKAGLLLGFTDVKPFATSFDPESAANPTKLSTQDRTAEVAIALLRPAEQSPLRQRDRAESTFVGGWAYDTGDCRQGQDHGAPIVISTHAARTASSECDFRSVRREDASRWRIVALCSREGESWRAHVDLRLTGSNLTWSSERGTANYVRCVKP